MEIMPDRDVKEDKIQMQMAKLPEDIKRLVFVLAEINPQNPNQFATVCFGTIINMEEVDSENIDIAWLCFRMVQDNRSHEVMLQTPPPAMKWRLGREQYLGNASFQMDVYNGPGHTYRMIWIHVSNIGPDINAHESSRIIKPAAPPIIIPGR
jgi:hypothetical protein